MNRFLKSLAFVALVYVAPLLGVPKAIFDYKILVLAVACTVMFLTQPELSFRDAGENQRTDRKSVLFILIAGALSQIVPVVEWGYFSRNGSTAGSYYVTFIGLALIIGGLALRIWSIRKLGRFFTATVQIVEGHRLVKEGPFALVRHPSYLGAYLAIVGSAIFLNAPIGTLCAAMLMLYAYKKRITAEEVALIQAFGEDYREYQQTTKMIVPFVW